MSVDATLMRACSVLFLFRSPAALESNAAAEGVDFPRYLLRLIELELLDRDVMLRYPID